jgi:hypothetical protein
MNIIRSAIPYVEDTAAFEKRRAESSTYFEQLGEFSAENAENKNLGNPAFWYTAASYIAYVNKNYDKSSENTSPKRRLLPLKFLPQTANVHSANVVIDCQTR